MSEEQTYFNEWIEEEEVSEEEEVPAYEEWSDEEEEIVEAPAFEFDICDEVNDLPMDEICHLRITYLGVSFNFNCPPTWSIIKMWPRIADCMVLDKCILKYRFRCMEGPASVFEEVQNFNVNYYALIEMENNI